MHRLHIVGVAALATLMAVQVPAQAQEPQTFRLTLSGHRFEPAEIAVPAGAKIILVVRNADTTPAEFESRELDVEKVISAGREATIRLGPLTPGRYSFMDEFHPEAKGELVATQRTAGE